jgi:hypothetical protein
MCLSFLFREMGMGRGILNLSQVTESLSKNGFKSKEIYYMTLKKQQQPGDRVVPG